MCGSQACSFHNNPMVWAVFSKPSDQGSTPCSNWEAFTIPLPTSNHPDCVSLLLLRLAWSVRIREAESEHSWRNLSDQMETLLILSIISVFIQWPSKIKHIRSPGRKEQDFRSFALHRRSFILPLRDLYWFTENIGMAENRLADLLGLSCLQRT